MRFAAVLLAALAIFVAVPNAALAAAPQHHDLPTRADPADLARYIATILYGKAVQSAGSASRGKLQRVIEMALRTLPL